MPGIDAAELAKAERVVMAALRGGDRLARKTLFTALEAGGIEVTRDLAAGLPRIKGDALLLQQALLNLVINAEQAIAGGGRLAVLRAAGSDARAGGDDRFRQRRR